MLFRNIIGQEDIKKRLIRSVKENRISHAQLILGPEGSGKLALAIAYAQYISCENKKEDDSCGECRSCVKYEKLIHPDLHFLYPFAATKESPISASHIADWRKLLIKNNCYISLSDWYKAIGMDQKQGIINASDCNEVIKTLSLKSYESEYKVMIIWMIEKLFHSAAPKLLKILEEPPDILPKRANEIVRMAEGNYKEAIMLASNSFDDTNFILLKDWMRKCYKDAVKDIIEWVDKFSKAGRENHKSFLLNAIRIFRESMLVRVGISDLIKSEGDELKFASDFSPFINTNNTALIIKEFNDAIFHIERNANPKILFLDLSLKMTELIKIKG